MKQIIRFNKVMKSVIILGDLLLLNTIFISLYYIFDSQTPGNGFVHPLPQLLILLNLVYLLCNYSNNVILYARIIRPERIISHALRNTLIHSTLFISLISLADIESVSVRFVINLYSLFFLCLVAYWLTFRYILKKYRKYGRNTRSIIYIGNNSNLAKLYNEMAGDSTTGYRIIGYFNNFPSDCFPESVPYLGHPQNVIPFLQKYPVEQVYVCLPNTLSSEMIPIINYCENHMIRFYSVPIIPDYLKRRLHFEMYGNVPVFSVREEPLSKLENRLLKRTFDLLFSILFLCTLFPLIYIIVGIAIKLSSPGPIIFKQKRSGESGKEFWCYKFRSMHVNKDCDKLQATEDDPRKTQIGEFIRKNSIDELPQFINVLLGQMSVVGPRPHMLKHTEEYSRLIDKYMVRHLVKPGITGWAQVHGYRGATQELRLMKGRVQRDVWYLEHWTFLLDIYIIYKTIMNAIHGEKEAY